MIVPRVVAQAPATLTHRFSGPGAADVRVTAVDADGITRVDDQEATEDGEVWSVALTPAQLPAPTVLEVAWSAPDGWVETDLVDVAGGRYLTPADVKAGQPEGHGVNRDRFDDRLLAAAIAVVEDRIEVATGLAWVPRFERTRHGGLGSPVLQVRAGITQLLTCSIDGQPVDVDGWRVTDVGILTARFGEFPAGSDIELTYLHGRRRPPADLVAAAADAARDLAKGVANSRVPRSAESVSAGGYVFNFAHQADLKRGRPFGLPDVDTVVMSHAVDLPAVA